MKKILYLSFYFEPDLCAGSFRNTSLLKSLKNKLKPNTKIYLLTTTPNRYSKYKKKVKLYEEKLNLEIHRIKLPKHNSNFLDQIFAFSKYFYEVLKISRKHKFDLVFASSSRLFTGYLGSIIAKKNNAILYLDIRDIFLDTLNDLLKNKIIKFLITQIIKYFEIKTFSNATHINLISKGFNDYFKKYKKPIITNFTNGIDDCFLNATCKPQDNKVKLITYAGNIGSGQGLHKIIPELAKQLNNNYKFKIIGAGGCRLKLINKLNKLKVNNVEVLDPIGRKEVNSIYSKSHYLFLHLNDFKSFKKVLPSKVFELGAYPQPLIAGVSGYAEKFISSNLKNFILFKPCDVESIVKQLKNFNYKLFNEKEFKLKYSRKNIDENFVESILSYI